jgi:uncharacterized protein YjiS (DUF1127 family)
MALILHLPTDGDTAPPLTRRLRVAVAAWSLGVRLGARVFRDEAHLREMESRLLTDVGLTHEGVARGALRPERNR